MTPDMGVTNEEAFFSNFRHCSALVNPIILGCHLHNSTKTIKLNVYLEERFK